MKCKNCPQRIMKKYKKDNKEYPYCKFWYIWLHDIEKEMIFCTYISKEHNKKINEINEKNNEN